MNNLQYIIENDTRAAMHMAVELCEQGDFDSVTEAFGWLMQERNDAALGGGTLTAEQVKRIHEIIEKHWHDLSDEYDMPEATALPEYSYNWQAIADELNATLDMGADDYKQAAEYWQRMYEEAFAERTCECVAEYAKSPIDGKTIVLHRCSACHELMRPHMAYCPNCGAKVVKDGNTKTMFS